MTLQTGKRKISKVTNAFSKAVAIATDEPTLGQSTDCLNCCRLVELIQEKFAITADRGKITQLLTIVPCNLSISEVGEVFNISEYTARQGHEFIFNPFSARTKIKIWHLSRDQTNWSCITFSSPNGSALIAASLLKKKSEFDEFDY